MSSLPRDLASLNQAADLTNLRCVWIVCLCWLLPSPVFSNSRVWLLRCSFSLSAMLLHWDLGHLWIFLAPGACYTQRNHGSPGWFPFSSLLFSAMKTPLLIHAIKQTLATWGISGSGAVEMRLTSAFRKFLKSGEKRTNESIQSNSSHLGHADSRSLNCRDAYASESSFVWVRSVTQERELALSGKAEAHLFKYFFQVST